MDENKQQVASVAERAGNQGGSIGASAPRDPFRKDYGTLTTEQKEQVAQIKDKAKELYDLLTDFVPFGERSDRSRDMALARTYLEDSVMRAVRAVTTLQKDEAK